MRKPIQLLFFASAFFVSSLAHAQSEVILSYNGDPVDVREGLDLSKISYPLVKLEVNQENGAFARYPYSEVTLVRGSRAMYTARGHGMDDSHEVNIKLAMKKARQGDRLVVTLMEDLENKKSKRVEIPIR